MITAPIDGSTIADNTPVITGTGEPGATVTVSLDGTELGDIVVGDDNTWQIPVTTPLDDGEHTATAVQTDEAGNESNAAASTFTIDATAPVPPVVVQPANGSTTGPSPTVTGTAEDGADIEVFIDGTSIGTAVANDQGAWQLPVTTPLAGGSHTVYAIATDEAGNESGQSNTNTFTVDATAPAAPVIIAPANGATIGDSTPLITGTGEPGATVTVSVDGTEVADDVVVDENGDWSFQLTVPLSDAEHTATATQTDPAGNESPEVSTTFTVDTTAPAAPVITAPVDGSTVATATPAITGTGVAGSTVTVSIDGTQIGTSLVTSGGSWSVTPTTPLSDAEHTATATQSDPAGNESAADSVDVHGGYRGSGGSGDHGPGGGFGDQRRHAVDHGDGGAGRDGHGVGRRRRGR